MSSDTVDFKPYGLKYVLTKESNLNDLESSTIAKGYARIERGMATEFHIDSKLYKVDHSIGKGTYGETYKVNHTSKSYAVKMIHFRKDPDHYTQDLQDFLRECIIHIILWKLGPYVPEIFTIGYDSASHTGFIVTEIMRNTLHDLISVYGPEMNDLIIPDAVAQTAKILAYYQTRVGLNHRDLKADNIMYNRVGEKRVYKLIDFGFACITWNGIKIMGGDWPKSCVKWDRDLTQLIYALYTFYGPQLVSPKLKHILRRFLLAEKGPRKCNMGVGCSRYHMTSWKNTYNFLDQPNVYVPQSRPRIVKQEMERFEKDLEYLGYLPNANLIAPQPCDAMNTWNGVLGRCVQTRRNPKPKTKAPKICPEGKILNPKTNRCVLDRTRKIKPEKPEKPVKACPEGKVLNPKTNRCIKVRV